MKKIEFFRHNITELDIAEVNDTLRSIFLTTASKVAKFEQALSEYLNVPYSVGVSSCTAGLHLVLKGLGIKAGDEVITSPLSFIASANAIEYVGARPVFVDVEDSTGNINVANVEKAITPKTRAILAVHLYGQMSDVVSLSRLAAKYDLKLIEDSAHALEAKRDGIRPGQLSDAAVFSFYATKTITSGEGGAIVTKHKDLYEWLKKARLHGMSKDAASRYTEKYQHYDMEFLGYKYNMTDIQASLLLGQLARVEKLWRAREKIVNYYNTKFSPFVRLPKVLANVWHAYYIYTILIDPKYRDNVIHDLQEAGIGLAVNFRPIHLMTYYKDKYGFKRGDYPVAEKIGDSTITIPLYPSLTKQEMADITSKMLETVSRYQTVDLLKSGVTLFFPCYNEEGNVENVVTDAWNVLRGADIPFEIIIVNDGSTDKTGKIAESLTSRFRQVRVLHHSVNKDYGLTLQTGFTNARYPIVGYMDGDGQFEAADFVDKLLPKLASADLVTGQRVNRADPWVRKLNAFLWNITAKLLFGIKVNDVDCGMKVIKKAVLDQLNIKYGYATVCQEIHFKVQDAGFKTAQVPVTHKPRVLGVQTGANPWVIMNYVLQLFQMRLELWFEKYWRGNLFDTFKALPRFIRFGTIGFFCFVIQFLVVAFLVEVGQIIPIIANLPAFVVATAINFYLSLNITWTDRKNGFSALEALIKFFVLGITNEGLFALFGSVTSYQPALFAATVITAAFNYVIYSRFIFTSKVSQLTQADA